MKLIPLALLPLILVVFGCSPSDGEDSVPPASHGTDGTPQGGQERSAAHGAPAEHPGAGGHPGASGHQAAGGSAPLLDLMPEEEVHLRNLRRITEGGADAEAYFSADGKSLVLQTTRGDHEHDQIYMVDTDGSNLRRLSPGPGKTTCSFFFPGDERIVYATTHLRPGAKLIEYDRRKGERWTFDPAFDIVSCNRDGTDERRLTSEPGYDAECAVSRATGKIVFCSTRTGDPELFVMDADGSNVKQLTDSRGYDGGPFFSVDGTKIVWRTYQPSTPEENAVYDEFLSRNVVGSWPFDIWIMNADGSGKRRITTRGEEEKLTCWAPYLHPDNRTVAFVSQSSPPGGRGMPNFDLFTVDVESRDLDRITFAPGFEGFPMFSDDGKKIAFVSGRAATSRMEISVFLADWVP